ncbi:MAG: four helix bundle protein [Bacteroidetes bacterium]|nr:four helix bundle protein [Bacteroidota bacterium]
MNEFRFENMRIWQEGMRLSIMLFEIANLAEDKKYFRFADQLRGATMSITNNIAEGAGSTSDKDFAHFLNISKRSIYECVNILHLYEMCMLIQADKRETLYPNLAALSKQITNFRKALLSKERKM